MQKTTTLIFDLGGVIINLKTEKQWLEEDLIPNFQSDKLHQFRQQHFFNDFEIGKINAEDFIQKLISIAVDKLISEDEIIKHWNGILLDIPKHRVDFLQQLNQKYRLILLSNTNHIHLDFIRAYMQSFCLPP